LTHLTGGLSNLAWSSDGKSLLFLFIENAIRGASVALGKGIGCGSNETPSVQEAP
jgi:hypothetical protein